MAKIGFILNLGLMVHKGLIKKGYTSNNKDLYYFGAEKGLIEE